MEKQVKNHLLAVVLIDTHFKACLVFFFLHLQMQKAL